jgi:hypothetical protein
MNRVLRALHWLGRLAPRRVPPTPDTAGFTGDDRVRVAPSLIPGAGLGAFAARDFAAGEVVCEYTGEVLTSLQVARTPDWAYVMGLGRDRTGRHVWLDPRAQPAAWGRYLNHHDDPARRNVVVERRPDERRALLVAARAIARGEELLYDYGARYWAVMGRRPSGAAVTPAPAAGR